MRTPISPFPQRIRGREDHRSEFCLFVTDLLYPAPLPALSLSSACMQFVKSATGVAAMLQLDAVSIRIFRSDRALISQFRGSFPRPPSPCAKPCGRTPSISLATPSCSSAPSPPTIPASPWSAIFLSGVINLRPRTGLRALHRPHRDPLRVPHRIHRHNQHRRHQHRRKSHDGLNTSRSRTYHHHQPHRLQSNSRAACIFPWPLSS